MIAIIGDLINSRRINNRFLVQEQLQGCLNELNAKYSDQIVSKFSITLGDEFQGLLLTGEKSLCMVDEVTFSMFPCKIRFGLGIGNLNTSINHENCLGMDGPVFWRAREAIEIVHGDNDYHRANIHLCSQENEPTVKLINEILKLTALQVSGWRKTQNELYKFILDEAIGTPDQISHTKLASMLGISRSSLTRRFESSGIKRYMKAHLEAESAIERINQSL